MGTGSNAHIGIDNFSLTALGAATPEINVKQGATNLASGDTYTYPNTLINTTRSATFTIENTGSGALTLTGTAPDFVTLSGTNASEFSITQQPASATVAASGTTTFVVTFAPTTAGAKTAKLTVANDDANEGTYEINLSGTALASLPTPEINVVQGATAIASGDTYSGFTPTVLGSSSTTTFTIQNTSATDPLTLGSFNFSGPFALSGTAPTTVAANSSVTFDVVFTPTTASAATGSVSIVNDDANENPYLINFSAQGLNPTPVITAINPTSRLAGGAGFSLVVTGSNFLSSSVVYFNGVALTTTFNSATQLTAAVPASAVATAGSFPVTVVSPTPGGGTSNAINFEVLPGPLVIQDFEDTPPANVWSYTGTITRLSGNSAVADRPSNSPLFTSGSKAWGVTNGDVTVTFSNQSLIGYRNAFVTFRLAAWSLGSGSNGMDAADNVNVEVSLDGGTTWRSTLQVNGNGNAHWDYTGTGSAETTYDGDDTPAEFATPGGGLRVDGISTVKINLPATATQVRVRITMLNNSGGERWTVDDVALYGIPAPAPTITSFTPNQGPYGTTVTVTGTNFVSGATGVLFNGTPATVVNVLSSTQVEAQVPIGASTGKVSVVVGGQTAISVDDFTVIIPRYYAKATGALNDAASYGSNPDGSGPAPASLATAGIELIVVNNLAPTISANLTLGAGSKLIVGNGVAPVNLTIPAAFNLVGTVDLTANSTLTVLDLTPTYTLGTVDPASTVDFAQAGNFTVPVLAGPGYGNLKLTNGQKRFADGVYVVRGNLTVENVTGYNGSDDSPFTTVELGGNYTLLGTVTYPPNTANATNGSRFTLNLVNPTTPQVLSGNGKPIELFRLNVLAGTATPVLNTVGGSSHLFIGNSGNGTLNLAAGTLLDLNGNNLTIRANGTLGPQAASGQLTGTASSAIFIDKTGSNAAGSLRIAPGQKLGRLLVNIPNGSGELTLANSTEIDSLDLTSGFLIIGANNTLTLNGPVTAGAAADAQFVGSATSSLTFGGTDSIAQINFSTIAAERQLLNLTLNRAAGGSAVPLGNSLPVANLVLTNGVVQLSNTTHRLTATTVTGGNATSYVNGNLVRPVAFATTDPLPVFFPVGTAAAYRPLTFTVVPDAAGTASYRARAVAGDAPAWPLPADIANVSRISYHEVERVAGTLAAVAGSTVTLPFGSGDGVNDLPNLRVVQNDTDAASYVNLGGTPAGTPANGSITAAISAANFRQDQFNVFALANAEDGDNPLPVVLTSFSATQQGPAAQLRWTTSSEKNSAYFEVLRSTNGREFTTVGRVEAAGNSAAPRSYSLLDAQLPAAATLYYRLRQVDADGTAALSAVVMLKPASCLAVALYPNPAAERLTLETAAPVQWQVRNGLGQTLLRGTASGLTTVDVSSLPAGVYHLEARSGQQRTVQKFVKR
ncbi:choice-of-anchor D domain-containing protein [Hymenobacter sp. B81]|uniref:choice-of-anchor D domain-containing protein n=1 Tax=Hymenobacter sp. B81 TaxID=3344878 RepID=UPI0037DC7F1B